MAKLGNLFTSVPLLLVALSVSNSSSGAVLFSDGFESGNISHVENGISWYSPESVTVVTERAKSGSRAAKFHFRGSSDLSADSWAELRFSLGGQKKEVWLKYDLYVPSNYRHRNASGASNNKGLVMLWGGAYRSMTVQSALSFWPASSISGASRMCADIKTNGGESTHYCNQSNMTTLSTSSSTETVGIEPAKDNGKWHTFVIHVKLSDIGKNNGVYEVWKNGAKIWSTSNVANYASSESGNYLNDGYLLGWANSGFDVDTDFYVDNVVFGTTGADVGASDTPSTITSPPSPPDLGVQ